ncbi:MAG: HNH endonuclease [Ilumatobacteraceae bacterium]
MPTGRRPVPKRTRAEWDEILKVRGPRPKLLVDSYRVDPDTGCWIWTRHVNRAGYAALASGYANRAVYEMVKGEVPWDKRLESTCGNTVCVNPDHLVVVSPSEQWRRRRSDQTTSG